MCRSDRSDRLPSRLKLKIADLSVALLQASLLAWLLFRHEYYYCCGGMLAVLAMGFATLGGYVTLCWLDPAAALQVMRRRPPGSRRLTAAVLIVLGCLFVLCHPDHRDMGVLFLVAGSTTFLFVGLQEPFDGP